MVPDGFVLGAQVPFRKTGVLFASIADSTVRYFGSLPSALVANPRVAATYPFSLVAYVNDKVVVGFIGSEWLYRTKLDGTIVDSARATARQRRGVPDDLADRLHKDMSPDASVSTGVLVHVVPPFLPERPRQACFVEWPPCIRRERVAAGVRRDVGHPVVVRGTGQSTSNRIIVGAARLPTHRLYDGSLGGVGSPKCARSRARMARATSSSSAKILPRRPSTRSA